MIKIDKFFFRQGTAMSILMKIYEKIQAKNCIAACAVFLLQVFVIDSTAVFAAVSPAKINAALSEELNNYPEELVGLDWFDAGMKCQDQWLVAVYQELGIQALWVNENGPTDQAEHIFAALKGVDADGLNPSDYGAHIIASEWRSQTAAQLARLDIDLTLGLLAFIYDMKEGRLAPRLENSKLFDQAGCVIFDPVASISEARNASDMATYLAGFSPGHRHYRVLKQQLKKYRNISEQGGWPLVGPGKTLHPGESDFRVPAVRRLLTITGDLQSVSEMNRVLYGEELEQAVKVFQDRHGLEVDGIVGKRTIEAFDVSVAKRIRQILINMERWRWTERELGSKYVLVDIAGFGLQGVVDDTVQLEMRVIVGKQHHESPVFSDTIKYIDFNPYWNITPDIASNEMLAKLRTDSNYLDTKHIRLFSSWQADSIELVPQDIDWSQVSEKQIRRYKLRQEPGPWNALGVVKFVFPNKYSVYIHDTPGRDLFDKTDRAFSHGCIRISEPKQLAEFLLADSDVRWTQEMIGEVIDTAERKVVRLQRPIPVHLVYQTAWVDKNGAMHFSKDLYGRDQQLVHALFGE